MILISTVKACAFVVGGGFRKVERSRYFWRRRQKLKNNSHIIMRTLLLAACRRCQVYYAAVVADLVLRFNWLYSLIPPGHNPLPFIHSSTLPVFITTSVIVCEFLRRTMWGFFRVENEHLNNTEVGAVKSGRAICHCSHTCFAVRARQGKRGRREAVVVFSLISVMCLPRVMATPLLKLFWCADDDGVDDDNDGVDDDDGCDDFDHNKLLP